MLSTILVNFPESTSSGLQQLLKHIREIRQIDITTGNNESGMSFSRLSTRLLNHI
jgi:hypothetical protein